MATTNSLKCPCYTASYRGKCVCNAGIYNSIRLNTTDSDLAPSIGIIDRNTEVADIDLIENVELSSYLPDAREIKRRYDTAESTENKPEYSQLINEYDIIKMYEQIDLYRAKYDDNAQGVKWCFHGNKFLGWTSPSAYRQDDMLYHNKSAEIKDRRLYFSRSIYLNDIGKTSAQSNPHLTIRLKEKFDWSKFLGVNYYYEVNVRYEVQLLDGSTKTKTINKDLVAKNWYQTLYFDIADLESSLDETEKAWTNPNMTKVNRVTITVNMKDENGDYIKRRLVKDGISSYAAEFLETMVCEYIKLDSQREYFGYFELDKFVDGLAKGKAIEGARNETENIVNNTNIKWIGSDDNSVDSFISTVKYTYIDQVEKELTKVSPQCTTCDRFTCTCHTASDGYIPCSTCDGCNSYAACSCNQRCHSYSTACTCNATCHSQGTTCSCNATCHSGYSPCSCDGCYKKSHCKCNPWCYSQCAPHRACKSNGYTCFGGCNASCYSQAKCSCNTGCNAGNQKTCSCNARCYTYTTSCSCDQRAHGYNPCATCNGCNTYSACACDQRCHLQDCSRCHHKNYSYTIDNCDRHMVNLPVPNCGKNI